MNIRLLPFFVCFFLSSSLLAQLLVSASLQEDFSTTALDAILPVPPTYALKTYKITYQTTSLSGEAVVASGMLSVPYGEAAGTDYSFPLAVYMHGTASSQQAVPSRVGVGERTLVNSLATHGYITLAPDYLGLGDDDSGLHPYVHAATEASAGRDMLIAVKTWLAEQNVGFTQQLFLTGYSQGGHASMALHRDIELRPANDELLVTAAAHLSGPYSISGVMGDIIFQDQGATLPAYLAYTYISYNNAYALYNDLSAVFAPPYLSPIQAFAEGELELFEANAALELLLEQENGLLRDMFQDSIISILQNQPNHPMLQALRDNDVYDWAPQAPTILAYCTEDEQVPFQNAILADSVMKANGSSMVQLYDGGALDHGGCVNPAATIALFLFGSLSEVVTSTRDKAVPYEELRISPNPVRQGASFYLEAPLDSDTQYEIYNSSGQLVAKGLLPQSSQEIPLPHLPASYYLLRAKQQGKIRLAKFVVQQ